MVTKVVFLGWSSLYGRVNLDLIKNNFLISNGYSFKDQLLIYPHRPYLVASKNFSIIRESNNKSFEVSHELVISSNGFLLSKLFLTIDISDYKTIFSDKFLDSSTNQPHSVFTLQELAISFSEKIFGKPIIEVQFDFDLKSDYFTNLCVKYGIEPNTFASPLNFTNIVVTSNASDWELLKKFENDKANSLQFVNSDIVVIPNFDNTLISENPDIHLFQSSFIILYAPDRILINTTDLVIGMFYKTIGIDFLRSNLNILQHRVNELRRYVSDPESTQISWIYVNRILTSYENILNDFISIFEFEFLDYDDMFFFNFQNIHFKENLEQALDFTIKKKQYLMLKNNLLMEVNSLRRRVLDKGEKEERMANERIVAVISFLAIFQVIIEILPLFGQQLNDAIRILFLILLFPTLIIIWYITIFARRRRIKTAENLEKFTTLKRQQTSIHNSIIYLKETINQKVFDTPDSILLQELSMLQVKLNEITEQIAKFSKISY